MEQIAREAAKDGVINARDADAMLRLLQDHIYELEQARGPEQASSRVFRKNGGENSILLLNKSRILPCFCGGGRGRV